MDIRLYDSMHDDGPDSKRAYKTAREWAIFFIEYMQEHKAEL
jgi:hypothetical protein